MAGTNKAQSAQPLERAPAMILVEPQLGENIGAAARALWNFGLADLRLVAPRDGWPNERAIAMASGADVVLERVKVFADTASAVADCTFVYATTARPRDMTKHVFTPEAACADMRQRMAAGERIGILFGRERTGLETADVNRANAIISVPVNPAFASLNLAQCVLLMAYEWRRAEVPHPAVTYDVDEHGMATQATVDGMLGQLMAELEDSGYFWPDHKRGAMMLALENIFRRAPLTDQDVRTLRGAIRALGEERRRKGRDKKKTD